MATKTRKESKPVKVNVTFTEGWEDRMAQAAVNLYLRIEDRKNNPDLYEV